MLFDGDDTLWHNEPLFAEMTSRFRELLSPYHSRTWIDERLFETEVRNLRYYGYGIKSYVLSMIETATELTEGRITGTEIREILEFGKEMLQAPVRLLDHVEDTVAQLREAFPLVLVTKGDLFDQESKIARSGLGDMFAAVEIVTDKDVPTYQALASRNGINLSRSVMVGDSLRSDILPVLQAGGNAIHIPYGTAWQHESVPDSALIGYEYLTAESIREVPELVDGLVAK